MNATVKTSQDPCGGASVTLGQLIYADQAKLRVLEEDWLGIVNSIAAGDQPALRVLYEQTHRIVFTLALRLVSDRESAEELTLDVFHEVWRGASAYDAADGSVIGWIVKLAHTKAINWSQGEQRMSRVSGHAQEPVAALAADALTVLTVEERQAIETACFSELADAHVAAPLYDPSSTLRTRVRTGLVKLRAALAAKGTGGT